MRCGGISSYETQFKKKIVVGGKIDLSTIYTDDESMRAYADATPSGKLELSIDNPEALEQFIPGKYYSITIEQVVEKK